MVILLYVVHTCCTTEYVCSVCAALFCMMAYGFSTVCAVGQHMVVLLFVLHVLYDSVWFFYCMYCTLL